MGVGGGAALLGADRLLGGLGTRFMSAGSGSSGTIVIGFVSPQTGDLADFATSNTFAVKRIRQTAPYSKGLQGRGQDLRRPDHRQRQPVGPQPRFRGGPRPDPEQQCRPDHHQLDARNRQPRRSRVRDRRASRASPRWSHGRPGMPAWGATRCKPTQKFEYNVMFFFGLEGFGKCFVPMWNRISTNKVVAEMFPNDSDGNAFRAAWPWMHESGRLYRRRRGRLPRLARPISPSMISDFKSHDCEIYVNVPLPPDFNTFWKQAAEQEFKPKLATVAKVLLFPADVTALGPLVNNIATDSWWSPFAPYKSALTGETAADLAVGLPAKHRAAVDAGHRVHVCRFRGGLATPLTAASDPHDHKDVADKLHSMKYEGMNGEVDFTKRPGPRRRHHPGGRGAVEAGHQGQVHRFPLRDVRRRQFRCSQLAHQRHT